MMLLLLIGAFLFLGTPVVHDFHVSRCEIVFRSESRSLEITQHMFADDVELALQKMLNTDESLHLSTEIEEDAAEPALQAYLADRLEISFDGRPVQLSYLGREPGEDNAAMWVYIEAVDCGMPDDVSVRYDLLTEIFSDQKNILSFRIDDGDKQMYLLDKSSPSVSFKLRS